MAYSTLNLETIIAYVRDHDQSPQYLDPNAELEVQEIGDGNLNLVWRVFERENRSRSILLKQGLPYLRAAGESWPLSPDRARFEALMGGPARAPARAVRRPGRWRARCW